MSRRLGTYRHTVWRWASARARPNYQHRKALVALAESMGMGSLFIDWEKPGDAEGPEA